MNEVKCFWQSQCPYYEQTTSYGTEILKCENTDCPLFSVEKEGADMNKIYFTFEGDVLVKNTPCQQLGENIYKTEIVIDKETFLECMKRWTEESEEPQHDARRI